MLSSSTRLRYPPTRRDESIVDDYHDNKIRDPYRWLEDYDSKETKDFVKRQMTLTNSVLQNCETRDHLRKKITDLYNYEKFGSLFWRGNTCFFLHNTGLQSQSILYMQDGIDGQPEVLVDPNLIRADGTAALKSFSVSKDAKYLAYGLIENGSDWQTLHVIKVEDKTLQPYRLPAVSPNLIAWTNDGLGSFYPGIKWNYHALYYHFIGKVHSQDILCWMDTDHPDYTFKPEVTDDGKYLIMTIEDGTCNLGKRLSWCDLSSLSRGLESFTSRGHYLPFNKLVDTFEAQYKIVSNDESLFTLITNKDAPTFKLVRVDLKARPYLWSDVLKAHEKDVLALACAVNGDQLATCYLSDVKSILQIRDLKSGSLLRQLHIDIGTDSEIYAQRKGSTFFFMFSSFFTPAAIYKCDLANEPPQLEVFRETSIRGFDRELFQVTQDKKEKIPMFIVARKDIELDKSHPCLLHGYGGFGVSQRPSFNVAKIVLAKHLGVVLCFANIRGGGEYGESWHRAGALENKCNSFDDFISGAEYLVSMGYTQERKICFEGSSNGGLLVAACINERPDLFGCALAHSGVMDMLRFHKHKGDDGAAWVCEYGSSAKKEEFDWLIKYSPLHNVRGRLARYPSTMLLTGANDDRTMQHTLPTSVKDSPIVCRIQDNSGHGAGLATRMMIDEAANRYAFMAKMVKASWIE